MTSSWAGRRAVSSALESADLAILEVPDLAVLVLRLEDAVNPFGFLLLLLGRSIVLDRESKAEWTDVAVLQIPNDDGLALADGLSTKLVGTSTSRASAGYA